MHFKDTASFLEKISLGASGVRHVMSQLQAHGYRVIELERGATTPKLWSAIKIKRDRIPDLLLVSCGRKIEVRAKSTLEVSMSHSDAPNRAWDVGLSASDFIAFVPSKRDPTSDLGWQPKGPIYFASVSDLKKAEEEGTVFRPGPKGAQEGFESRIVWPTVVSTTSGTVLEVTADRISVKPLSGRARGFKLTRKVQGKLIHLSPLVAPEDVVEEGTPLASVVALTTSIECPGFWGPNEYMNIAANPKSSPSDVLAAIKAIGHLQLNEEELDRANAFLERLASDERLFIKLEAVATLIRLGNLSWFSALEKVLDEGSDSEKLETVLLLSELKHARSRHILESVLARTSLHPEIRSAAAWALGRLGYPNSIPALVKALSATEKIIKMESAFALQRLARLHANDLMRAFTTAKGDYSAIQGVAWALSYSDQHARARLIDLALGDPSFSEEDTWPWIAFALSRDEAPLARELLDRLRKERPHIYWGLVALHKYLNSWVRDLE